MALFYAMKNPKAAENWRHKQLKCGYNRPMIYGVNRGFLDAAIVRVRDNEIGGKNPFRQRTDRPRAAPYLLEDSQKRKESIENGKHTDSRRFSR